MLASCCVDEVAAQHGNADAIIHFGHSCLSPTHRLPVCYIFGRRTVDMPRCCEQLQAILPDTDSTIILVYDVIYHHAIGTLRFTFLHHCNNLRSITQHCCSKTVANIRRSIVFTTIWLHVNTIIMYIFEVNTIYKYYIYM